jgi:ATPase family associated with various cellular activities (AAA)
VIGVAGTTPAGATEDQGRELAEAVLALVGWAHATAGQQPNEVAALVQEVLGDPGAAHSVVTRQLPPFEHVNLQVALDAWSTAGDRSVEVRGVAVPPHHGGVTLQQLVSGEALPPLRLSAPGVVDLPDGPGSTRACLRLALLVVTDADGRYVLLVQGPVEHQQDLLVEVAGLPVDRAQAVLAELDRLRSRLNVYRRQLLEVGLTLMGGVTLTFLDRPATDRDDVVLPAAVLDRIERHALGVAEHRAALAAAGQHLKRGLLLYGPPGTGKTHTAGYLLGRMGGYTRLLLTGRSLGAVGAVAELARDLQPAVLVMEDVDLVAADRSFGPGGSPVLFELLDAMDGAAPDADLLFVLTTNRADLLEPALAARPGRVDVAVEIDLPDAASRRRLLELYGRDVPLRLSAADVAAAVERSDGVTASFLKELVRRAVLEALRDGEPLTEVTGAHLARALDDLLDAAQSVTRTLLGVGVDPAALPVGPPPPLPGRGGWMAHPGRRYHP